MQEQYYSETPILTVDSINAFCKSRIETHANFVQRWRTMLCVVMNGLPEGKELSKENLLDWREAFVNVGYSAYTVTNYVKLINMYLIWCERDDLCFERGQWKDLTGRRFGKLIAIEPTGEYNRKDRVWRCVCDCGREKEASSSSLTSGNVTSCGCRASEPLKIANKYIEGTSILQAKTERLLSTNTSGYPGVFINRGKWRAVIVYKGKRHYLGSYTNFNDAVEARKRAKDLVREDAEELEVRYDKEHADDVRIVPMKVEVPYKSAEDGRHADLTSKQNLLPTIRANNTSGIPGVSLKRGRWLAKITWQGVHYSLGTYETKREAVRVRKGAETVLNENPENAHENLMKYKGELKLKRK